MHRPQPLHFSRSSTTGTKPVSRVDLVVERDAALDAHADAAPAALAVFRNEVRFRLFFDLGHWRLPGCRSGVAAHAAGRVTSSAAWVVVHAIAWTTASGPGDRRPQAGVGGVRQRARHVRGVYLDADRQSSKPRSTRSNDGNLQVLRFMRSLGGANPPISGASPEPRRYASFALAPPSDLRTAGRVGRARRPAQTALHDHDRDVVERVVSVGELRARGA